MIRPHALLIAAAGLAPLFTHAAAPTAGPLEPRLAALTETPAAAGPLRLVSRTDGLEVFSRELRDGALLVALVNRSGATPPLAEDKARYAGPVVSPATPGRSVRIETGIEGAKKLWLVVTDAGDGNSGDHADWAEPVLSGPAGNLRLTDLRWTRATSAWRGPTLNKGLENRPMKIADFTPSFGIAAHAESVIEYDLPAGYAKFSAITGLDNAGRGSVRFLVFTENPRPKSAAPDTVAVPLRDLGFAGGATLTPVAGSPALAGDTLSADLPVGGIAVARLTAAPVAANTVIRPGEVMGDTEGRVIQAHGGGILYHDGAYYWYGENKDGPTSPSPVDRTDVIGVSCYSSRDLLNWKNEGVVLKASSVKGHDLHPSMVLERPKVIRNAKTGKFVMWAHIDSANYQYARAGVAVSDSPTGPFEYLGSVRPEGQMARDQTVFVDDDGSAYHIYSSEHNATTYISKLSDDYTKHTGVFIRVFEKKFLEAPAVFKRRGKYHMIASGQSGWAPNPAHSAVADSMLGAWKELGNPCVGEGKNTTFRSQSTFVLPLPGKPDTFIYLGDRWNPKNLRDSRYVWLPLRFEGDKPVLEWRDAWSPAKL